MFETSSGSRLVLLDVVTRWTSEASGEAGDRGTDRLLTAAPADLLDEVAAWQRAANLAFSGLCRAVGELEAGTPFDRQLEVGDEVGLVTTHSPGAGSWLLGLATWAVAVPGLLELVEAGTLTEKHLRAGLREIHRVGLTGEAAAAVGTLAVARLAGRPAPSPGEFGRIVQRCVLLLDPAAAERREEKGTAGRSVQFWPDRDGQAALTVKGPAVRVMAMSRSLDAVLAGLGTLTHQPGDDRLIGARRFDALAALVTGTTLPVPTEVHLMLPLTVAAGGDLELAHLPGYGPVLPATARDLAAQAAVAHLLGVDVLTGEVLALPETTVPLQRHECQASEESSEESSVGVSAESSAESSAGSRLAVEQVLAEHLTAPADVLHAARPAGSGAAAAAGARAWAGSASSWTARSPLPRPTAQQDQDARERDRQWHTDQRRWDKLADPDGTDPTQQHAHASPGQLTALADVTRQLTAGPFTVADLGTAAYRPGVRLRRFVKLRDQTCCWPGCPQKAQHSDLDHQQAWPHGSTTPENLHALCRHHHQVKQLGWIPTREPDGTTAWRHTHTGTTWRRPPPEL